VRIKNKHNKLSTYKFRLYPKSDQEQKLLWTMQQCRFVYNTMLEKLQKQDTPNRHALQNSLPRLKEQYPHLQDVYSKALQYEIYRLFSNLRALSQSKKKGRYVGKLRFKSISGFKTIHYNQSGFKIIKTNTRYNKLHITKIGDIRMCMHRDFDGRIKQVIIKCYGSAKWFASITVEENDMFIQKKPIKKIVGIDMGITEFLTDTTGKIIENPTYLKKSLKQFKKRQRRLSRTKKKSNNRRKQIVRVARLHEKVINQRNDYCHKVAKYYVDNFDFIAVEDLNINDMLKSINKKKVCKKMKHYMKRNVLDVSWRKFFDILSYKAEWAGKTTVRVNPCYTSRIQKYGASLDKDYNASLNILERGLKQVVGQGLSKFTPLEIVPPPEMKTVLVSTVVEAGSHFENH
jgi:putative transposase